MVKEFFKHKFFRSEFALALTTTSFTTGIQVLVGLIINKILAITIGPSGIAMMGQFTNFKDIATNLANGSFGTGVTKYIADPDVDNRKVLATSNLFTLIISISIGIIIIIFSSSLSSLLFKTTEFKYVIVLFGITVPLFGFNNLLISMANGYRNYKFLAQLKTTNSITALIFSSFLAWYFKLDGALLAQALNTSIIFFISYSFIYNIRNKYFSFNLEMFDLGILKKLLLFSLMAVSSTLLKPIVQLFLRDYIITNSSGFEAGIWEGVIRISNYYTQIITVALGVYYLPKLSSLYSKQDLNKEIWYGLKIVMPIIIFIAFGIYILRQWIIQLLFSQEFESMSELILPQLFGDIFMVFSFMIGYLLLAKAMIKEFITIQLTLNILRVALSVILFEKFGTIGFIYTNAIVYVVNSIILITLFRKILFIRTT